VKDLGSICAQAFSAGLKRSFILSANKYYYYYYCCTCKTVESRGMSTVAGVTGVRRRLTHAARKGKAPQEFFRRMVDRCVRVRV
jgi:hypothetical protein